MHRYEKKIIKYYWKRRMLYNEQHGGTNISGELQDALKKISRNNIDSHKFDIFMAKLSNLVDEYPDELMTEILSMSPNILFNYAAIDIKWFDYFLTEIVGDTSNIYNDIYNDIYSGLYEIENYIPSEEHVCNIFKRLLAHKIPINYDNVNNLYLHLVKIGHTRRLNPVKDRHDKCILDEIDKYIENDSNILAKELMYTRNGLKIEPSSNNKVIYMMANLSNNYFVSNYFYEQYIPDNIKSAIRHIETKINKKEQVVPPFWLDNIYQMKNRVIAWMTSVDSDDIVRIHHLNELEKIDSVAGFSMVLIQGRKWLVKPDFTRYFGARHLRANGANVVNKKLLFIGDNEKQFNLSINVDNYPFGQICDITCDNIMCLSEYVDKPFAGDMNSANFQCHKYWNYGFYDNFLDNCYSYIDDDKNPQYIIIDTDTDKNFYDSAGRRDRDDVVPPENYAALQNKFAKLMTYNFGTTQLKISMILDTIL